MDACVTASRTATDPGCVADASNPPPGFTETFTSRSVDTTRRLPRPVLVIGGAASKRDVPRRS